MRQPLALALGLNLLFATVYKSVAGTKLTCPLVLPRSGVEGKRTLRERAKLVANDPLRTLGPISSEAGWVQFLPQHPVAKC